VFCLHLSQFLATSKVFSKFNSSGFRHSIAKTPTAALDVSYRDMCPPTIRSFIDGCTHLCGRFLVNYSALILSFPPIERRVARSIPAFLNTKTMRWQSFGQPTTRSKPRYAHACCSPRTETQCRFCWYCTTPRRAIGMSGFSKRDWTQPACFRSFSAAICGRGGRRMCTDYVGDLIHGGYVVRLMLVQDSFSRCVVSHTCPTGGDACLPTTSIPPCPA